MNLKEARPIEVLLVEDNLHDVELTRISFERARFKVNLHHVENGQECLAFLRGQGTWSDSPEPDIILLDINMPIMDGKEVLVEIGKDPELCHIPVVVLTTSTDQRDVMEMYKLHCSSYISKPVDFNEFRRLILELGTYWFTVVVLPENGRK